MWYVLLVTVAVGGVIGYLTNWLAIKMLFRPYKAITIFGWRLPFTPGVIPKERYRLSESIGTVITSDILTPDDFKTHFENNKFITNITNFIHESLETLLDIPLKNISINADISVSLFSLFEQLTKSLLCTPGFNEIVTRSLASGFNSYLEKPLGEIIDEAQVIAVFEAIDNRDKRSNFIKQLLCSKDTQGGQWPGLQHYVDRDKLISALEKLLRNLGPGIQHEFIEYCKKPEIHKQLETLAMKIIQNYIQKMNALQRFIVNIGRFDAVMYDSISNTVDDAITAIGNLFTNHDIHARIAEELTHKALNPTTHSTEASQDIKIEYVDLIDSILESVSFSNYASAWYDYVKNKSIKELLQIKSAQNDLLTTECKAVALLVNPESKLFSVLIEALKISLAQFFDSIWCFEPEKTLRMVMRPEPETITKISETIGRFTVTVIVDQIPVILKLVDIKELIRNKLDNLDMAMLEQLTVRVMNKELRAITLLGGVLGALIGLFQAILLQVLR